MAKLIVINIEITFNYKTPIKKFKNLRSQKDTQNIE